MNSKHLAVIEQVDQKQCPGCSNEGSLSRRNGHLVCDKCDDSVRDDLGWLGANVEAMLDEADGQVARIARLRELVEYLAAVADMFDECGIPTDREPSLKVEATK